MSQNKVLIIDNDAERAGNLKTLLEFIDFEGLHVPDQASLRKQLGHMEDCFAVMLTEQGAPEAPSKLIKEIKAKDASLPILFLVDEGQAPALDKQASADILSVITLPVRYAQLHAALHQAEIFRESRQGGEEQRPVELFRSMVGNSRAISKVRHMIEQVAESDANVLILGESGTGKEVVARNLHYYSTRRDKPFVPINCGAIPPDLLESELFGHEKGAFTGAISARQGRFEMAEGGTLFLDEIGDMSLPMQVKLLRVLQERTFERVGSNKSITTDVRIVAATHRDLEEGIKENKFREDLYYRLNVFPIDMPPLRERAEDVPLLINELILRIEHEKRGSVRLTNAAVLALCHYPWPGNVRELANLIERLAILYPFGVVDVNDLPAKFRSDVPTDNVAAERALSKLQPEAIAPAAVVAAGEPRLPRGGIDLKEHLSNLEITFIKQALDDADGVVAHAAKRLGMRRTTLVEKLRKYGLQRGEEVSGV